MAASAIVAPAAGDVVRPFAQCHRLESDNMLKILLKKWLKCGFGVGCPCWLFGDNARRLEEMEGGDDGNATCCLYCCGWYILRIFGCCGVLQCATTRQDIRHKYNLVGDDCAACCFSSFCAECAICQEANEIRLRAQVAPPAGGVEMQAPAPQDMAPTDKQL